MSAQCFGSDDGRHPMCSKFGSPSEKDRPALAFGALVFMAVRLSVLFVPGLAVGHARGAVPWLGSDCIALHCREREWSWAAVLSRKHTTQSA